MPDEVLHLSALAGSPLLDSAGERLGRVTDVVARLGQSDPLPPISGLRATIGGRSLFVPVKHIARLEQGGAHTSTTKLNLASFERRPGEVLLRADVLGHSLINVNTARLVTAGEVGLSCEQDGVWRVAGIDPSFNARMRRHLPRPLRSAEGRSDAFIPWSELEPLVAHVPTARLRLASRRIAQLHPAQIADLVEAASHDEGEEILEAVGQDKELEADVFEELDDEHQLEFLDERSDREVAGVLSRMASDDAADLLLGIKQERRLPVLGMLPAAKQRKLRSLLGFNPSTAGGVMSADFITMPLKANVGAAVTAFRSQHNPHDHHAILLTHPDGSLAGTLAVTALVGAKPAQLLAGLAEHSPASVTADSEIPEVARLMTDYNLVALPVVDADGKPIGIVSVDDILELTLPEDWRRRYGVARE